MTQRLSKESSKRLKQQPQPPSTHNFEFKRYGSVTGYDEFLRLTDPELVKLELDCGWVVVAGKDPVAYLTKYPERYRLLHIKDFKKGFIPRTTLLDKNPGAPVPTE